MNVSRGVALERKERSNDYITVLCSFLTSVLGH
jgi:hypothetical protein